MSVLGKVAIRRRKEEVKRESVRPKPKEEEGVRFLIEINNKVAKGTPFKGKIIEIKNSSGKKADYEWILTYSEKNKVFRGDIKPGKFNGKEIKVDTMYLPPGDYILEVYAYVGDEPKGYRKIVLTILNNIGS